MDFFLLQGLRMSFVEAGNGVGMDQREREGSFEATGFCRSWRVVMVLVLVMGLLVLGTNGSVASPEDIRAGPPQFSGMVGSFLYNVLGSVGEEFRPAIEEAFKILSGIWQSPDVPVEVRVVFSDLGDQTLGSARQVGWDIINGQYVSTSLSQYWKGVEASLLGVPDIEMSINSKSNWYLGVDGNPGSQLDLVSAFTHEVIHGLLFNQRLQIVPGVSLNFSGGVPDRFESFLSNAEGCSIASYKDPADRYALVTNNNLFLASSDRTILAKLYAPFEYEIASSIYHLDYNSNSQVMAPELPPGVSYHDLGSDLLRIFQVMLDRNISGAPVCSGALRDPRDIGVAYAPRSTETVFLGLGLISWIAISVILGAALAVGLVSLVVFVRQRMSKRSQADLATGSQVV
mmetsp:Transcript_2319/g.3988  ORF Transcript_2319/g.3988 Transcript_2319/m.3988 type:complete len:401 (-) Transcript_2319:1342-2544(-)